MSDTPARRSDAPRDWAESGDWPNGALALGAPVEAGIARGMARRLEQVLGKRHGELPAGLAERASAIADGRAWPDFFTVVELETELGVRLWPDDGRPATR